MQSRRSRKVAILAVFLGLGLAVTLVVANWDNLTDLVAATAPGPSLSGVDEGLVAANNQFAFDLYAQLAKDNPRDNIFFSPLSLSAILAQTYAGARGNTAKEMKDALHFDLEPDRLHPAMAALLASLNPPSGKAPYELSIANALWIEQSCSLLPEFVSLCKDHYGAALRSVDFKHAAGAQCKMINDWVEEQTHGRITDLMPPDSITSDSRLVLTNAVYFKGNWLAPFYSSFTKDEEFKMAGGRSAQVPMMGQIGDFIYMEQSDLQVLEMPYVGNAMCMVVLLPRKVDGLANLERMLNARTLGDWVKKLRERRVDVDFPKFGFTKSYRFESALQASGMRDAFRQNAANFSGMSAGLPLYLSAVVHKAFVNVNEEGTEGAAGSGCAAAAGCVDEKPPPPQVFRADHPFIFLIRDMWTGSTLFIGRVMNPKV